MKISRLLSATALAGSLFAAPAAWAQTASTAPDCTDPQNAGLAECVTKDESIVVTGSRIRRPNIDSPVPVTSIAGEQFFQQGQNSIGDTLNDLPQLRSTFAQQNPGLGIGIAGLSLLDLRGLGTQRTLVLVNGRRHVPADILNNAVSPDVSSISSDLIERVEIVTGGNSAIYGSDAIAGVVNFILRQNFEGLQVRGQAGVVQDGYGGNQLLSAMYGKNFADGKGNITVQADYSRADRVFASDVPAFRSSDGFGVIDSDGGTGIVNGGDGYPDRAFFRDFRGSTIHYNGLVPVNQRNAVGGACGNATTANNGGPNSLGAAFSCTYIFTDAGRLVQQTGTRFGTGINSSVIGGNGQTGREGHTVSVLPFNEHYNGNLLAHYEVAPELELFVEAKWNRVNTVGNNAGPSFIQGTQTQFDFRERTRLDNPFLNPADRTTLSNAILASGCRTDLSTTCPAAGNLTAADITAIGNGSYRFVVARNLLDVGLRDEHFSRDTWRVVGGIRGNFNGDWNYELSLNYGKFREKITTEGYIDRQRFMLAMDAGLDPVTNTIKCRSQYDPASAVAIQRTDAVSLAIAARNQARLAADIAACKPYNPFGQLDNSAAVSYFSRPANNSSGLQQLVVSGFVAGDFSQLFELPGGPVGFAVGGEYRQERAFYTQDPFVTDGFTNGVSIPSFVAPAFQVKEAYGELNVPLLKNMPFFDELTLTGAGRVASYQGDVGTVWAYNAGAVWAPIPDIRFRANYGHSVRAPNVSETAFPLVPNFAPGFVDPCQTSSRGTGIRNTNCMADLSPTLLANLTDINQSLGIISGSNPSLKAETSNSLTVGAVLQPRFIRGLSLTADYYQIKVNGIITSLSAQTIVNSCYDSASLNNIFCGQFQRNRGTTNGPNGEVPGRILFNTLISAPLNFAARERRGIDVNFEYRTNLGPDVKLGTSVIYVHVLKNSNYQDPTNPNFETNNLGQLGDPKDEFRWDLNVETGPFTFGYNMHYIGPMLVTAYSDLYQINGIAPANIDYADTLRYPEVFYHAVRFDFDIGKDGRGHQFNFYGGVDNLLDTQPPLGSTATGAGSSIYSFRGRTFYAGFKARF
ncbi:TonB-dependent receptor [Sphingomonas sp. R-74633]|uniref:TonB-dependent receptor domain-containing protein n=1 Tax=Sphingomonas sp. R-74633 TaxID=2751188 RepID=UPI0015D2F32D|nr:TonB-dependent receptor [Sphingomonas sp. R-74633]NYT42729.1 TonB-dependent receptor [Sphingomonas sp. R-74633]